MHTIPAYVKVLIPAYSIKFIYSYSLDMIQCTLTIFDASFMAQQLWYPFPISPFFCVLLVPEDSRQCKSTMGISAFLLLFLFRCAILKYFQNISLHGFLYRAFLSLSPFAGLRRCIAVDRFSLHFVLKMLFPFHFTCMCVCVCVWVPVVIRSPLWLADLKAKANTVPAFWPKTNEKPSHGSLLKGVVRYLLSGPMIDFGIIFKRSQHFNDSMYETFIFRILRIDLNA